MKATLKGVMRTPTQTPSALWKRWCPGQPHGFQALSLLCSMALQNLIIHHVLLPISCHISVSLFFMSQIAGLKALIFSPASSITMWLLKIKLKWYNRHPSDSSGGLIFKGAHWLSFLHMRFLVLSSQVSVSKGLPFPVTPAPHFLT